MINREPSLSIPKSSSNPFQDESLGAETVSRIRIVAANWQESHDKICALIDSGQPEKTAIIEAFKNLLIAFISGVNLLKDSGINEFDESAILFSRNMADIFLKLRAKLRDHATKNDVDQMLRSELGHEIVTANDILQSFKAETTLPFGKETLRAQQGRQRVPFVGVPTQNGTVGTTTQTQHAIKKTLRPPVAEIDTPRTIPDKSNNTEQRPNSKSKIKRATRWLALAGGLSAAGFGAYYSTHTGSQEPAPQHTISSQPGANEITEPTTETDAPTVNKEKVKLHFGVDRASEGYQKFIKYFAKNGMSSFNEAMANAARQTHVEVSADTDKESLPFITYRTTLENCKKGARGFFLDYCNIRLRQLDLEIERLKKEGKELSPENVFTDDSQFGDKLAFDAFSSYAELPDPSTLAGYTIETNMDKNPALQRFHNRFAGPTGAPAYYQVVYTALQRIEQKPCTTPEITECLFERSFEVAAEESAKAKKHGVTHGAASILRLEKNNFDNGRTSRLNDIAGTYNVIKKPDTDMTPASEPLPPSEQQNKTVPVKETKPIHTLNGLPWNQEEESFFARGESISNENTLQQIENDRMVKENPEIFTYQDPPKKQGFFAKAASKISAKATDFGKKIFTKKELTSDQKEMAELKKSIPKKSLFRSLFG